MADPHRRKRCTCGRPDWRDTKVRDTVIEKNCVRRQRICITCGGVVAFTIETEDSEAESRIYSARRTQPLQSEHQGS